MKIRELVTEQKKSKGIFIGVRFSKDSKDQIMSLIEELGIENPIPKDDLHCTVIYTKTPIPELLDMDNELSPHIFATVNKFELFKSEEGNDCLVLLLTSKELTAYHNQIIKDYNAKYTFDEYKPHITLSYNCTDKELVNVDPTKYIKNVEIISEYSKELDD